MKYDYYKMTKKELISQLLKRDLILYVITSLFELEVNKHERKNR